MYKFTNGIVVFDEKTRDRYIHAGYRLVETINNVIENTGSKPIEFVDKNEELDENSFNDGTIEEKSRRSKKVSK